MDKSCVTNLDEPTVICRLRGKDTMQPCEKEATENMTDAVVAAFVMSVMGWLIAII